MIHRIDVGPCPSKGPDRAGQSLQQQIQSAGIPVHSVHLYQVYFLDSPASPDTIQKSLYKLLADPITEHADLISSPHPDTNRSRIEVHLKPGVMDPVAASAESALRLLGLPITQVRTGRALLIQPALPHESLQRIATQILGSPVIESVHYAPFLPASFPTPTQHDQQLRHIPLTTLDDTALTKLSRDAHLFLSLPEMQAIRDHYQSQNRQPTDVELETIAQTWSEHCVHKTLKSKVEVYENGTLSRTYANLIKQTIFSSTLDLIQGRSPHPAKSAFCLSVFKDNAGVVSFDSTHAVCFKVETHNRPSAIDPYGGAATGIGGCIRDVMGTGLGAKPIASTDIFCTALPDAASPTRTLSTLAQLPPGVIHPQRVLKQVVAGVRDYGNRMGIPTVNGALYFDDRYVANPLVFCGCVGLLPRSMVSKKTSPGDAIVVLGGRTGRDGIHGATFSSSQLTNQHADEFSHAVQIGNAIEQKRTLDVLLQARDQRLYSAVTDCGAGGLSSAVGEMGADLGAIVHLDRVPLKYAGLRYDEIWISEAQERMVVSAPQDKVDALLALAASEDVEATVIGTFGTPHHELILLHHQTEVARLSMHFLHDGIPMPTRRAVILPRPQPTPAPDPRPIDQQLLSLLASPNIASKHWVIRQYDHEVQGGSVIKPLVGPLQRGPSDAAVIRPKLNSQQGVVLANGLAPHIADPYQMAIASIDEALRNAICVGADPDHTAILDNFCWPGTDSESAMGDLVRACEACRDAALAFGTPFISGKDSLNNQFTNKQTGQVIRIPNTLLISSLSVIQDVQKTLTMDFKTPGSTVVKISPKTQDLPTLNATHRAVATLIATGQIAAAHDASEGGWLTALAEMAIASNLGITLTKSPESPFQETLATYLLELTPTTSLESITTMLPPTTTLTPLGTITTTPTLQLPTTTLPINQLTKAWLGTLDW